MSRHAFVFAGLLALAGALPPAPAAAQDPAAELVRKAKAGEADGGFCAASKIERIAGDQVQAKINQALSANDAEVRMSLAVVEQGTAACFVFVFKVPAQREGKKCRATEAYTCITGEKCEAKTTDFICETKPGTWD